MKRKLCMIIISTVLLSTACGSQSSTGITPSPSAAPEEETAASEETTADEEEAVKEETVLVQESDNTSQYKPTASEGNISNTDTELDDESIGPVSFMPNQNGRLMVYGSDTLHAYFKREGVVPGKGRLVIRNLTDESVVEEIDLTDSSKCQIGKNDSTFSLLGWDGGTHLIITLDKMPEQGGSYYVTLEEGAFTSKDKKILSKAITDKTVWPVKVAKYGILLDKPDIYSCFVGDVLNATIYVREPAVIAKIENYDENRVRFNEKEFVQDGKLEIKVHQIGKDPFTVNFYDKEDDLLGSITLTITATMPPEPEEEAPRNSITNL